MTESELLFRLTDEEYQEFIRWFSYKFYRGRSRERITLDLLNLKAETQLQMESWGIHIQSGHKNLKLLYSVIVLQPYKQRRKGRKAWTSQKKQLFKKGRSRGYLGGDRTRCSR